MDHLAGHRHVHLEEEDGNNLKKIKQHGLIEMEDEFNYMKF